MLDYTGLEKSWSDVLSDQFSRQYMEALNAFLESRMRSGEIILPESAHIFAAFNATPFNDVKVVIIGQDPYPTIGHAHGLAFSVQSDVTPLPKSLKNIFIELDDDISLSNQSGNLTPWARQGVLLLNSVLTVESGKPGSHMNQGWETFTNRAIEVTNSMKENVVFVLWGSYAKKKGAVIDRKKHYVIESPHPSPLSAYRGFFKSRPFSRINQFLSEAGSTPIDWKL